MYPVQIANILLTYSGLAVYFLLFLQIVVGLFLPFLIKKFGKWVVKLHIAEGLITYLLALMHVISFVLVGYFSGGGLNIYTGLINVCFLCNHFSDYYYTAGKISFWLLTLTVGAGILRKTGSWFIKNWEKVHVLNYAVFIVVGFHGFFMGSYIKSQPFFTLAVLAMFAVFGMLIFLKIPRWYRSFKIWLEN